MRCVTYFEEFHQIVELPVNVSAYGHRAANALDIGLFRENFFGLLNMKGSERHCQYYHEKEKFNLRLDGDLFEKGLTFSQSILTSCSGIGLKSTSYSSCLSSIDISSLLRMLNICDIFYSFLSNLN